MEFFQLTFSSTLIQYLNESNVFITKPINFVERDIMERMRHGLKVLQITSKRELLALLKNEHLSTKSTVK